jgi:Ca2+-binding RTX toxin-like protein
MSPVQADEFLNKFEIIFQYPNDSSGLSATLMRNRESAEYTLSLRSTEFQRQANGGDWERDGISGAVGDIALRYGFALGQIASMETLYEHLRRGERFAGRDSSGFPVWVSDSRLSTFVNPAQKLNVTGYSLGGHLATVFTELHPGDVLQTYTFNAPGRGRVVNDDVSSMVIFFRQVLANPNAAPTPARDTVAWLLYQQAVRRTGPLEQARIYDDSRYRWAAFATAQAWDLGVLGVSGEERETFPFSKITHLYGRATHGDREAVANAGIHGPAVRVYIEDQPDLVGLGGLEFGGLFQRAPGDFGITHSITLLGDSLALMRVFQTLDPELDAEQLGALFAASSNKRALGRVLESTSRAEGDSLENALDGLRAFFLGPEVGRTLSNDEYGSFADSNFRNPFHQNLAELRAAIAPYEGSVSIIPLAGVAAANLVAFTEGPAALAARYALTKLNPFMVIGDDTLYDRHNPNGELDLVNPATGAGTLTTEYIADRARFLAYLLERNTDNLAGTPDDPVVDRSLNIPLTLSDKTSETEIFVGGRFGVSGRPTIRFGSSESDTFSGDFDADRLFGLGGDDQLDGNRGADYLEGGAGNDVLQGGPQDDALVGGAGNDFLLGGPENDVLVGGPGADRLEGGPGNDTYRLSAQLDADTIVDRDGWIYAGSDLLTGGSGPEGGPYMSSDGRFSYTFSGDLATGGTLTVNGALRIEGFRNGDLGIRLVLVGAAELPEAIVPVAETVLLGDIIYEPVEVSEDVFISLDPYGNPLPVTAKEPAPDRIDLDWEFPGTPGNTHYILGGGDDTAQDRHGGDDHLELGAGNDAGFGGAGNDLIEGGPGIDFIAGGRGDDLLIAGTLASIDSDLDPSASPALGGTGGTLSGGDGDDVIIGNAEANVIEGGAGRDRIFGGAGGDWIGADVAVISGREMYGVPNPITDSILSTADLLWNGSFPSGGALPVVPLDHSIGEADEVDAGPGNDTVYAGGGDDTVHAGPGDDYVHAGAGADTVIGGNGNDRIETGAGADTVIGGDGNDHIESAWDSVGDYIDAGDGDDVVRTGGGGSVLIGGRGKDFLFSTAGGDVLIGGEGRDWLQVSVGGGSLLDGGAGDDFFSVTAGGAEQVNRLRWGRGRGSDAGVAVAGTLVVEADVSPSEVSVFEVEREFELRAPTVFQPFVPDVFRVTRPGLEFQIVSSDESLFFQRGPALTAPLEYAQLRIEFADGTVWDEEHIQALLSPPEAPSIEPSARTGSSAAELLSGSSGADVFSGGASDDWLIGGAGDDVYRYARGDGLDLIEDRDATPGNSDTLIFASGIAPSDVAVFASSEDYVLTAGDGGVRLIGGRTPEGAIERVEFSDGTLWTPADLAASAVPLPGNRAPQIPESFGSVSVDPGSPLSVSIPRDAISDPDPFDTLQVFAVTAEGEALPEWLRFDASALAFEGTPAAQDSGTHQLLVVAADELGAAAFGTLTVEVVGDAADSEPPAVQSAPVVPSAPAELPLVAVADAPALPASPAAPLLPPADAEAAPLPRLDEPERKVGIPLDPLYREMQERFDVLLQVGRANLGERYAEAVREFEERRMRREETPEEPAPSEEEVASWNRAMHAWHDRNRGFTAIEDDYGDGVWVAGWGITAGGERYFDGVTNASSDPGLANPHALPRLGGAGAAPGLAEGLRELR